MRRGASVLPTAIATVPFNRTAYETGSALQLFLVESNMKIRNQQVLLRHQHQGTLGGRLAFPLQRLLLHHRVVVSFTEGCLGLGFGQAGLLAELRDGPLPRRIVVQGWMNHVGPCPEGGLRRLRICTESREP